jgi:hypothetical protein
MSNIILLMRTSILLDDELAERFRECCRKRGLSMSAFLAEAGRAALRAEQPAGKPPFELVTYGSEGPLAGVTLDQPSALIAAEDEARYGQ